MPSEKKSSPSLRCGTVSSRNPNLKPSEVVRQSILEDLKADVGDWDSLEKTKDFLHNAKRISNLKAKIDKENNPAGHSFEAVAHPK